MKDQSLKSGRGISPALPSATSSPEWGSGLFAFADQGGQTTDQSGPVLAHAGHSASRAKEPALPTLATYGRSGFGSSASAGLSSCLANSLTKRVRGSILYHLTWKASVTPSGRLIFRLRASEARTDARDLASWPTPTTPSGGQTVPHGTTAGGRKPDGSKAQVTLENVARLVSARPTPRTCTGGPESAERKKELGRLNSGGADLAAAALSTVSPWATPAARDYRTPNLESFASRGGGLRGEQLNNQVIHQGPALTGFSAEIASGARLNPAHARWLMRIPPEWSSCAPTAMPSTLRRLRP